MDFIQRKKYVAVTMSSLNLLNLGKLYLIIITCLSKTLLCLLDRDDLTIYWYKTIPKKGIFLNGTFIVSHVPTTPLKLMNWQVI